MAHTTAYRTLKAIADNFTQLDERKTEGGQVEKYNTMEFIQKSAMQQVIWGMDNMAKYQANTVMAKAKTELEQLIRSYTDTEIPQRQLQAKVSWCHRIQSQIDEIEGFVSALKDAYKDITGEVYQQRAARKGEAADNDTVQQALAILGKNIEVGTSYNSDSGKAQYN